MSKGLKDMSIEELERGYEKGKVTDEEIEQHLLEQIHFAIKSDVKEFSKRDSRKNEIVAFASASLSAHEAMKKLAEHEYQKLKDNE
ncbi:hypothetical protein [Gracilimonas sp.]|uniref:hypothetical protein n=1 Tax=Gracilimonas sp. TaxID=1974203 RepID=UPI002870BAA1|nr:hypothetical protein [Gracilimonas sp.]